MKKPGWVKKKIGEIAKTQYGLSEPMNTNGKGFKIFRMGEVQNGRLVDAGRMKYVNISKSEFEQYRLKTGDVLFNRTNSFELVGKTGIFNLDGDYCFASYLIRLNLNRRAILPEFLNYYMNSDRFQSSVKGKASKSINQANINATILSNESIYFPESLTEQRRIIGILNDTFDGIAKAKANAEKNLENARALFEGHLQIVFTKRGREWTKKSFSEVCEISSVLVDPRNEEYVDMLHVGGANIESKTGNLIDLKTAREEGLISAKFAFGNKTVLYSKIRPYLMKVARPDFEGLCSADIYPLSVRKGQLNRDYLFYLLLSPEFTDYANAGSARAGMPKVNRDHLFAFKAHFPPVAMQKQFAAKLDAVHEETQHLESIYRRKLEALDELKKSLLHKAFTGEL